MGADDPAADSITRMTNQLSEILPLRDRADITNRWLANRLDSVVPKLMRRENIDTWVLAAREYNEDPALATMLPATWFNARRRTILVFSDFGARRAAIARYAVDGLFPSAWDPESEPDQWIALAKHLEQVDAQKIAVNRSNVFPLADGLSSSEHDAMTQALSPSLRSRIVSNPRLAIGWLETRTPAEMVEYPRIVALSHDIVRRGLTEAIEPGDTSTEDLEWWFRQEVLDLGLSTWFQPTVSVQRHGGVGRGSFADHPPATAIEPGDLVHVDFGIEYLGLHTDMQQHSYVLRPGEGSTPQGLVDALALGNRAQDVLMEEFATGRTGNEVLQRSKERLTSEQISATIYTHAIGYHGHAAGPTIGLWDQQGGVPGAGDHPLFRDTAYSIELSIEAPVAEWEGQPVRIMLEEDAFFDGDRCEFLDGRQSEFWTAG